MTEVRARAARHKGQLNFESDLKAFLYAFGDSAEPYPETVRVLDEIVTDFIIETCHQAARSATYSNRQKIKVDDFKFAIRHNDFMLGRVQELLGLDKELKEARRQIMDDLAEGKAGVEKSGGGGGGGGAGGDGKPKKRGRKPKEKKEDKGTGASASIVGKKGKDGERMMVDEEDGEGDD